MAKGEWEGRVGMLLGMPKFVYKYKPVDSPLHGGSVRIDFHATDYTGFSWLIEVKSVDGTAQSINLASEVTALQRMALTDHSRGLYSVPVLAVGQVDLLYIWGWRRVLWLWRQREAHDVPKPYLLPLNTATAIFHWTGQTHWHPPLYDVLMTSDEEGGEPRDRFEEGLTQLTPTVYSPLLPEPAPLALMLKQGDLTLSRGKLSRVSSRRSRLM